MAKEVAKSKYASKVCGYLGVDKSKCERVFDKLYTKPVWVLPLGSL
jgi:hypothetical protein